MSSFSFSNETFGTIKEFHDDPLANLAGNPIAGFSPHTWQGSGLIIFV